MIRFMVVSAERFLAPLRAAADFRLSPTPVAGMPTFRLGPRLDAIVMSLAARVLEATAAHVSITNVLGGLPLVRLESIPKQRT